MGILNKLLGKPNPDAFVTLVKQELRRQGVTENIAYIEEDFALSIGDPESDNTNRMYLHNMFSDYNSVPRSERAETLERYVRSLQAEKPPEDFESAQERLLPRVRERAYLAALNLRQTLLGEDPLNPSLQNLNERLAATIVYDDEYHVAEYHKPMEEALNVPADQAFDTAYDNLRKISQEPFTELAPGLYVSPWQDTHDASRLLLTEIFHRMTLRGDPVAMIPHRDLLFVTGAEDEEGLQMLANAVGESLEETRYVSGDLFRLCDGRWEVFTVDDQHPAAEALSRLRLQFRGWDYGEQAGLLERLNERDGKDIFVANYSLVEQNGYCFSYSVWTEGADTLLPQTDYLAFNAEGDGDTVEILMVDWEKAAAIVGDLLEPQGLYPERFRVRTFPSDALFAELKALSAQASGGEA